MSAPGDRGPPAVERDRRDDDDRTMTMPAIGADESTVASAGAAGAAGDLVEELHSAFRGAQVAAGETQVSVDDADQR